MHLEQQNLDFMGKLKVPSIDIYLFAGKSHPSILRVNQR